MLKSAHGPERSGNGTGSSANVDPPQIISIHASILLSSRARKLETRSRDIRRLIDGFALEGCLLEFRLETNERTSAGKTNECPVCGRVHDTGFTQFAVAESCFSLSGVLPGIVRLVHQAHEKGFSALSTKEDALVKICGGYGNPGKAFDDLNRRREYKLLFDTRRRGFISLRGAVGRSRNKSESPSE